MPDRSKKSPSSTPRPAQVRRATIAGTYHDDQSKRRVPMLRLRGEWLRAAGFEIGVSVTIAPRQGELVVRPSRLTAPRRRPRRGRSV